MVILVSAQVHWGMGELTGLVDLTVTAELQELGFSEMVKSALTIEAIVPKVIASQR